MTADHAETRGSFLSRIRAFPRALAFFFFNCFKPVSPRQLGTDLKRERAKKREKARTAKILWKLKTAADSGSRPPFNVW
jgi:hypothetical protein